MPDDANNEIIYSSVYRHSVDDKRRLPVPFRWRPKEPIEYTVIVWPQHQVGTCLRVLGPKAWAKLMADLDAMAPSDNKQIAKRQIGSMSIQAKLDGSGRITIPEEMAREADITDQAVLVGLLDRFEIWNPDRHARVQASDKAHLQEVLKMVG